jgi:hypothetical protein
MKEDFDKMTQLAEKCAKITDNEKNELLALFHWQGLFARMVAWWKSSSVPSEQQLDPLRLTASGGFSEIEADAACSFAKAVVRNSSDPAAVTLNPFTAFCKKL